MLPSSQAGWLAGTPHGFMTRWLAHHSAVWLDDWHTT